MLPLMAASISASVGFAFLARRAAADMICPVWQKPHCGTSSSTHAFCTGWSLFAESPSMVVIFLPATALSGVVQARTGCPFTWTVQEPQRDTPQPYLVPVSASFSRMTHSKGMSGGASTWLLFPLTINVTMEVSSRGSDCALAEG